MAQAEALRSRYNEAVVDPAYASTLPHSVESFFVQRGSRAGEVEKVRNAHRLFCRDYPGATAPLVRYALGEKEPFSLVEDGC